MYKTTYAERQKMKNETFTKTNPIWSFNRLNQRSSVGCLNAIFKEFYNINRDNFENMTPDDFTDYYFTKYMDIRKFWTIVIKFYDFCKEAGLKVSKQDAFNYAVIRTVDATWDGFNRELRAIKNIKEWYPGADVHFSTINDMKYCIDVEVWYDDIFLDAYQIKPVSFLKGVKNNKDYCIKEYDYIEKRHNRFYNDYKIKPMYYIENKDYTYQVKDFKSLIA